MENKLTPYDLRLGNMLTFQDKIFTVAGLSNPQQVRLYDGMGADQWEFIDTLNPIPLTEEWLLKLGFKKDTEFMGKVLELDCGVSFGISDDNLLYYFGNLECFWVDILAEAKYLHQLQNIVFSLTGTELIIETQTVK